MEASKYLQRCKAICDVFEPDGCVNCPLKPFACGLPEKTEDQPEALRIAETFREPPKPYECPRCHNEAHPEGAIFCVICGLRIEAP